MPSTITAEKAALRTRLRTRLRGLSPAERQAGDALLLARFLSLPQVAQARTLLLYYGVGTEPDTARLLEPLWALGKAVCLPRCLPGNSLETRLIQRSTVLIPHHLFGIPEPGLDCPLVEPGKIDLALIPGLAFDRAGGRLGQGGGYYDRWLGGFSGVTVALCRELVLLDGVPRASHDRGVDLVVTERSLYGPSLSGQRESGACGPACLRDT